jgi:hypothetical protein
VERSLTGYSDPEVEEYLAAQAKAEKKKPAPKANPKAPPPSDPANAAR